MNRRELLAALSAAGLSLGAQRAFTREPDPFSTQELDPEVDTVVRGNNKFALDLYGQLRSQAGNLFFSPYSISTALAMTYAGARGQTERQMASTMKFANQARLHPAYAKLIRILQAEKKSRGYRLHVANSLWVQMGLELADAFTNNAGEHYGATPGTVDFADNAEAARQTINRWVAGKTNDKIEELLTSNDIQPSTLLILVNAVYFKAAWASPFLKRRTNLKGKFVLESGRRVSVPLMRGGGQRYHFEGANFSMVSLPYQNEDLEMLVLLPKKADGLAALERSLTVAKIDAWSDALRPQTVDVMMPRFKMKSRFQLRRNLAALGMPDAFDSSQANFSGMTDRVNIALSNVVHEATVEVNEEGTEATAATAIGAFGGAAPKKVFQFHADHPFVFAIRHQTTGSILFTGRVTDPTA